MKKSSLSFLFFFLFFSFLFTLNTQGAEVVDGDCSRYGLTNPCDAWIEYGCPQENYYGVGDLPEADIFYGSDVRQREVTQTCVDLEDDCSDGVIKNGNWRISTNCDDNRYCDKNDEGNFFCHLAGECALEGFPTEPLFPKNNSYNVSTPVGLDWCDVAGFISYKIELYEIVDEATAEVKLVFNSKEEEISINSSHYCLSDIKENKTYKWTVSYCREINEENCDTPQQMWKFETGEGRDIDPPKILSPTGNDNDVPFTMTWEEEDNAKSYYVEIYNRGGYNSNEDKRENPVFVQITTNTMINGVRLKPNTEYEWRIASCENANGTACGDDYCSNELGINDQGDFSKIKKFKTSDKITYSQIRLSNPFYSDDNYIPLAGPHNRLEWENDSTVISYRCIIKRLLGGRTYDAAQVYPEENHLDLETVWDKLYSNNTYVWTIDPCSNLESDCQIDARSEEWKFQSSGGTTEIIYPSNGSSNNPSDINFLWTIAPNAFSYIYEIEIPSGTATGTSSSNNTFFSYPEESIGQDYSWNIKACDGMDGTYCRDVWHRANFTIADFKSPSNPNPTDEDDFFTYEDYISWDPVLLAKAYKYTLQYNQRSIEEEREECINAEGTVIIEPTIIQSNRFPVAGRTKCLGEYEWWVTACFNEDCTGATRTSPHWTFNSAKLRGTEGGILPCNRISDNINTVWDETESCNIKHIPIFFYNALDFILWKASLIIFLFLIIASGIYSYAAAGLPVKIVSLKDVWTAASKGYSVMFLAWTIIGLILKVLGITDAWLILPF